MHKVYELRSENKVEYVGVTSNTLENRLYDHVKLSGKFPNRHDITIHEVSQWPTKKEAFTEETRLKISHGMPPTELLQRREAGKSARITTIEIAREIKSKYIPYKYSYETLAKEYNIRPSTVRLICQSRTYQEA